MTENPCLSCSNCKVQTLRKETKCWCEQGAFEFDHVPSIEELDFEYIQVNCSYFDDMDGE